MVCQVGLHTPAYLHEHGCIASDRFKANVFLTTIESVSRHCCGTCAIHSRYRVRRRAFLVGNCTWLTSTDCFLTCLCLSFSPNILTQGVVKSSSVHRQEVTWPCFTYSLLPRPKGARSDRTEAKSAVHRENQHSFEALKTGLWSPGVLKIPWCQTSQKPAEFSPFLYSFCSVVKTSCRLWKSPVRSQEWE